MSTNNNNSNNYINPELITYISHVQQEQQLRNKKTANIYYEKVFDKKYTGLNSVMNENINFDKVKKNQAKKGLLYLLNNLSKNNFCPEIETYFTELKKTKFNEIKNNYHQLIKKNKNLKNFRNNNTNSINNSITTINNNNNEDDDNDEFNSFSSREDQLKKNFEEEKLNILNKVMNNLISNQKESNVQWLKKKEKNNIEFINNGNNNKNYSNLKEYKNDFKGEDLENLYDIEELNEQKVFKFIPVKERLAKKNLFNNNNYKNINNNNENKGNKGKNIYKNYIKYKSNPQNFSNINVNNDNSLSNDENKINNNDNNNTIKENESIFKFSNSEISEKKKKELNLKLDNISS